MKFHNILIALALSVFVTNISFSQSKFSFDGENNFGINMEFQLIQNLPSDHHDGTRFLASLGYGFKGVFDFGVSGGQSTYNLEPLGYSEYTGPTYKSIDYGGYFSLKLLNDIEISPTEDWSMGIKIMGQYLMQAYSSIDWGKNIPDELVFQKKGDDLIIALPVYLTALNYGSNTLSGIFEIGPMYKTRKTTYFRGMTQHDENPQDIGLYYRGDFIFSRGYNHSISLDIQGYYGKDTFFVGFGLTFCIVQ